MKDGDPVQVGQVLVELDATNASADGASVREQLHTAMSEERRTAALAAALQSNTAPVLQKAPEAAGEQTAASDQAQLQAEWSDISARLAKLAAEQARRQAEAVTVNELIRKLESTLPIARQREADFKSLQEQGFMSSHAGQDRTRERIEQESDLAKRINLSPGMNLTAEIKTGRRRVIEYLLSPIQRTVNESLKER